MDTKKFTSSLDIPVTYERLNIGEDKTLLIFFHGFADSAKSFLRRSYPVPLDDFEILAVNGPFPVPQKKGSEWKHAFAWYFADFATNTVYISPTVAAKAVDDLLTFLQLKDRKKIVIAFSQGGFFVPHVLPKLAKVQNIFTIGAAYREGDYQTELSFPLHAMHGTEDEVISIARARESFETLKTKNPNGNFFEFQGMGHTMNDEARLWLSNELQKLK